MPAYVKGSRTPTAAKWLALVGAVGVREASGEETAGRLASAVEGAGAMGI